MKIRKGFISNSSSSSFVILAKRNNIIKLRDLPEWYKRNNFNEHTLWTLREGGCDGDWVRCYVDSKILKVLLKHAKEDEQEYIYILIDPFWQDEDSFWGFHPVENIPEDLTGFDWGVFEIDMHGPKTAEDWEEFFKVTKGEAR